MIDSVFNLTYLTYHIMGHQDNTKELKDLDRHAVLNVEVDWYAKYFGQKSMHNQYISNGVT